MLPRVSPFLGKKPANHPFSVFSGANKPKATNGPFSLFGQGHSAGTGTGIMNTINNVQKTIHTVQQAAPMIQQARQFGPMIKNLPNMYRMMRAINALPDQQNDTESATASSPRATSVEVPSQRATGNERTTIPETNVAPRRNCNEYRPSIPKFYSVEI